MFESCNVVECLGHFDGKFVPSLVCILMKQQGIHSGRYLLKTPRNAISETLNFKIPLVPLPSRTCAFAASSKATYYSLLASYLKTF